MRIKSVPRADVKLDLPVGMLEFVTVDRVTDSLVLQVVVQIQRVAQADSVSFRFAPAIVPQHVHQHLKKRAF